MDLLTFNQFTVLLWKNFTLKRRQLINLILEIVTALLFPLMLLLFRAFSNVNVVGPFYFTPQHVSTLPRFLLNPQDWELIYVPSNINVLKEITESMKRNLNINIKVHGFNSETEFEKYVKFDRRSHKVLAAIVFDHDFKNSSDPLPLQIKYHLRFVRIQRTIVWPDVTGWKTSLLFPIHSSSGPRNPDFHDGGSPGYISEGFLATQHALDKAIMLHHGSNTAQKMFDNISIFVQRYPYPVYFHDRLIWISSSFLPLMFILMFSPTVLSIMRSLVWEKENRLKEYQLISGLRNWMLWASYFFIVIFFYIIIISLICLLFFVKIFNKSIFCYSDYSFFFVFLMCYAIASVFFGFMVSTFFNKVQLVASAGSILYFASFFPFRYIAQNYGRITLTKKVASCLSSNVALALGVNLLLKLEIREIGVKWDNLWTPANLEDNLIFGYILGMLLLDAFLYGLVTWYVETVFPGKYGVPQPWYFFLMRSYWFGQPRLRRGKEEMESCERTRNKYFEVEPTSLVAGIQIKHLYKEFGNKIAVNDMSLNFYKGQISILLGQYGAGKTTVMSILTGSYLPTKGEAYINGYDISKNMVHIRTNLGFCPQEDLLFNDLTLSEHLYFYSVLFMSGCDTVHRRACGLFPGLVKRKCQKLDPVEIDNMLSIFNLLEKRNVYSKLLSAGTKRKLSVMIALIGGSKVMILDEPMSGMDPASRRATWDVLHRYKRDRTILLTTHRMEEADILGATYHVIMEMEPQFDVEKICAVIQSHIPDATLEKHTRAELSFNLPKEYVHRFEDLFTNLEKKQKMLGIVSIDASITTMEEVFLKISKLADSQMDSQPLQSPSLKDQKIRQDSKQNEIRPRDDNTSAFSGLNEIATVQFNTGFPLYCQQFYSMFIKRALFSWRHWKLMLLQIAVILFVTSYLLTTQTLKSKVHAREMDLSQYGHTIVPYSVSGNSDLALKLTKNLKIFLKLRNQELREVQGNITNYIMEHRECRDFSIIAFSIVVEQNQTVLTVLFNNEAYHSAAMSLTVLDNILFMSLSGPSASIKVVNKPQPLPVHDSHLVHRSGLQIVLCLAFGMAVVVGSFGFQTVTERTSKSKHIQFVSGVYVLAYWLSALLWDLIIFSVSCCLLLGVFKYCGVNSLVDHYHFLGTMLIFLLYGWSVIPLMYLGSYLFSSGTSAFIKLTLFNYFSTAFSVVMHTFLQYHNHEFPESIETIDNVLMMLPSYNFAISISRFFDDRELKTLCALEFQSIHVDCSKKYTENNIYSFGEHGIAQFLISSAALGLFYLLLLLCLETAFWRLKSFVFQKILSNVYNMFMKGKKGTVSTHMNKEYKEENVENERKKVQAQLPKLKNSPLVLKDLTKIYYKCPVIKAVRNISLVVKKSECFGLLGLNGAGKTTTIKMLTGEEVATSGAVLIDGLSIIENIRKVRSRIGYCPQSDPVLNHMTGRELLIMYARLRGVPETDIYKYVETFLHSLQLETHANEFACTYSRGIKRRLNTAIALMGKSSIVFLDEPSSGMDLAAKHLLWDTVTCMCKTGKTIIVTSHSTEECEALCTRLAIMVKGRFKCLGSPQQLKNKFSDVYSLTAKVKIDEVEDKLQEFKEFIAATFPGNIIHKEYGGMIVYRIPKKEICWGKVFSILEEAKVLFNLEDYSVSQITLEEIFLTFANTDNMESDQEIKLL
ncbi:ATP-binding cassette sub-family A member 3 isoform X5 [Pteropus alecto]|uniref:ATP-binding cassette sub-family A member 3 isoform X5 n=1 Tax=Pteropus alecto TaxID=9402 RepID=UPI000D53B4EF|nr:ATP-binding cassette sub-family A member 3 isoform X5 [Pteropus alecto]